MTMAISTLYVKVTPERPVLSRSFRVVASAIRSSLSWSVANEPLAARLKAGVDSSQLPDPDLPRVDAPTPPRTGTPPVWLQLPG